MQYKIQWMENKPTKEGKQRVKASLEEAGGKMITDVTIWGDFPDFENLMIGSFVEGDLVASKDPKYGPNLYPPRQTSTTAQTPRYGASRAPSGALEAAKTTAKSVDKAIERKEDGIKISATQRDAVLCAVAEYQEQRRVSVTGESLEKLYLKWREFFWKNYEVSDETFNPPF